MIRRSLFMAFFIVCCVFLSYSQEGGLRINEFQASNTSTIVDEDGLYSDWIELYNASSEDCRALSVRSGTCYQGERFGHCEVKVKSCFEPIKHNDK